MEVTELVKRKSAFLKMMVSISLVKCKLKNVDVTELRKIPRTPEKKFTSRGTDHKVTECLNHRLYDQKLKNCPDMLLVNFNSCSTFRTKLISTEHMSVLVKVPSPFGAISQLICTKLHGVTCQKSVLLNLRRNSNTEYYLHSHYP